MAALLDNQQMDLFSNDTSVLAMNKLSKSHDSLRKKVYAVENDLRAEIDFLSTQLQLVIESFDKVYPPK